MAASGDPLLPLLLFLLLLVLLGLVPSPALGKTG